MKRISLFTLILSILFVSCSTEERTVYRTDFSGEENRIASFALVTNDGKNYAATLCDNEILLALPADTDFESIRPEYLLAENASIQPDPVNIKDWSSEQRFLITPYSGQSRVYTYRITLVESENPQSVILATQEDVEAFGKSGQTRVTGNLIIGMMPDSWDLTNTVLPITNNPITSLSALSKLKQVDGELVIYPTYMASNLNGLNAVESLGGFRIYADSYSVPPLQSIYLPSLVKISNNWSCNNNNKLQDIDLPLLCEIKGCFDLETADLQLLKVPKLEKIGTRLKFWAGISKIPSGFPTVNPISSLAFPALRSVPYIYIYRYESVSDMDFSALEQVEDIHIELCTYFSDFSTFAAIVPTLGENNWKTENNAYNPSYQDMIEGRYTKQ